MKTDEPDDLWRLLGQAKAPTVSPFFSRNVLRAIREEKQEKPGRFAWLSRLSHLSGRWNWVTLSASTCVLLVVCSVAFHATQPPQQQSEVAMNSTNSGALPAAVAPAPSQTDVAVVLAQQVSTGPDYQVIKHLDELLASEETSVWLDK
jgi:hypothetical protein